MAASGLDFLALICYTYIKRLVGTDSASLLTRRVGSWDVNARSRPLAARTTRARKSPPLRWLIRGPRSGGSSRLSGGRGWFLDLVEAGAPQAAPATPVRVSDASQIPFGSAPEWWNRMLVQLHLQPLCRPSGRSSPTSSLSEDLSRASRDCRSLLLFLISINMMGYSRNIDYLNRYFESLAMDKSIGTADAYIRSLGPRPQFNAEQERAVAYAATRI